MKPKSIASLSNLWTQSTSSSHTLKIKLYTQLLKGATHGARLFYNPHRVPSSGAILFYHGLVTDYMDRGLQKNHMTVKEFRRQLKWLRQHRVFVSASEVRAALQGTHTLPKKWTLITFDDGYQNNLDLAAPELKDIPWLIYLATEMIDEGGRMPAYRVRRALRAHTDATLDLPCLGVRFRCTTPQERSLVEKGLVKQLKLAPRPLHDQMIQEIEQQIPRERLDEWDARFTSEAGLTWAGVRQLAQAGVSIGGHTHRHSLLHAQQSPHLIQAEITQCALRIQEETGIVPKDFCWPNGRPQDISLTAIQSLEHSSFEWATTGSAGCATLDPHLRWVTPRIPSGRLETLVRWLTREQIIPAQHRLPIH